MWLYRSPIGNFYIKQLSDGRYGLVHNGTVWESSHTPEAEADNVYMQCTGCSQWDCLKISCFDIPTDLSEWEKI